MYLSGSWDYSTFSAENYDVGVAALPMFEKPAGMVWSAAYMMAKDSKHPDQAFEFFKSFVDYNNTVEIANANGLAVGNLPNLKSSYLDAEKMNIWAKSYNEDFRKVIPGLITKTARTGECITLKNFGTIVDQTIMPYLDKVWLGEISPKEAADRLNELVKDQLVGSWE